MVFGLDAGWFEVAGNPPVGRLDDVAGWQRSLSAVGLVKVAADRAVTRNGNDLLLLAEAPPRPKAAAGQTFAFVIGSEDEFAAETASSLATLLVAGGVHVSIILDSEASLRELERETPDTVVYLAGAFNRGGEVDAAARALPRAQALRRASRHPPDPALGRLPRRHPRPRRAGLQRRGRGVGLHPHPRQRGGLPRRAPHRPLAVDLL
jgi:phthiocerol/phenolphthiocerol synthesis type-I polyketide synthase C